MTLNWLKTIFGHLGHLRIIWRKDQKQTSSMHVFLGEFGIFRDSMHAQSLFRSKVQGFAQRNKSSNFRDLPTDPNLISETDLDPFNCILTFACSLPNASFPSTLVLNNTFFFMWLCNHGGAEFNQML